MTTRANNSINSLLAAAIGLTLTAATVSADITYVDALEGSSGNTYATGGSLADTSWVVPGTSSVNETQWGDRAFANNATIFQGMHEVVTSDDMPELTTEISGLTVGTYVIWAFYWDQITSATQNWTLSTGLTSGALTSYSSPGQPAVSGATTTSVSSAATLDFTTTVLTDEAGNRAMYGVNLGQVTVSGGSVNVYADNLLGNGTLNRTWYDGVGYELVPEPSSTAMLGLGGLALILRRRRS